MRFIPNLSYYHTTNLLRGGYYNLYMFRRSLCGTGALKPEHLEDISRILEEYKETLFNIWVMDKYKKVTEFVKQLRVTYS